ncbi:hypothetical protein GCM10009527_089080 [Actinomadura nitritigenes]
MRTTRPGGPAIQSLGDSERIMNDTTRTGTPADDAAEEAARALQTALDRRDNGGHPSR